MRKYLRENQLCVPSSCLGPFFVQSSICIYGLSFNELTYSYILSFWTLTGLKYPQCTNGRWLGNGHVKEESGPSHLCFHFTYCVMPCDNKIQCLHFLVLCFAIQKSSWECLRYLAHSDLAVCSFSCIFLIVTVMHVLSWSVMLTLLHRPILVNLYSHTKF